MVGEKLPEERTPTGGYGGIRLNHGYLSSTGLLEYAICVKQSLHAVIIHFERELQAHAERQFSLAEGVSTQQQENIPAYTVMKNCGVRVSPASDVKAWQRRSR